MLSRKVVVALRRKTPCPPPSVVRRYKPLALSSSIPRSKARKARPTRPPRMPRNEVRLVSVEASQSRPGAVSRCCQRPCQTRNARSHETNPFFSMPPRPSRIPYRLCSPERNHIYLLALHDQYGRIRDRGDNRRRFAISQPGCQKRKPWRCPS